MPRAASPFRASPFWCASLPRLLPLRLALLRPRLLLRLLRLLLPAPEAISHSGGDGCPRSGLSNLGCQIVLWNGFRAVVYARLSNRRITTRRTAPPIAISVL